MPRIGLPAKPPKSKGPGAGGSSASPMAMVRVALGATAFRVISALVASFCAAAFARPSADAAATTFGLCQQSTVLQRGGVLVPHSHGTYSHCCVCLNVGCGRLSEAWKRG